MLDDVERTVLASLRAAREGLTGLPKSAPSDPDVGAALVSIADAERAVHARSGRRDADNQTQAAALARAVCGLEPVAPGILPMATVTATKTTVTIAIPLAAGEAPAAPAARPIASAPKP